ncbi:hypothetical protein [Streptomyces sp. NPDC001787]|uniref:hypothetical protein n=1 Tax=Streptomyces sp. NPDC001787 TaxID=3154523 RepID=UPI00332028C7
MMTHHRLRRRQLHSRRLLNSLQWLIASDDHQLAQTRYGVRESASERADRLEETARRARLARRQRDARRASREGQQWEDSVYASWRNHLLSASAPTPLAEETLTSSATSRTVSPHGGSLPALPPGIAPAVGNHHQRADAPPRSDAAAGATAGAQRERSRPALYLVGGQAPTPQATGLRRPGGRPASTGTKAGGQ